MFTGIVQQMGRVLDAEPTSFGIRLTIDAGEWLHEPAPGDSISVSGCCLTVVGYEGGGVIRFDVVRQTLRLSTLGGFEPGHPVNLEHAATPHTLLGGHIVQGHVDGVGVICSAPHAEEGRAEARLAIDAPEGLPELIVERGSIAVDGVSLTVAACRGSRFEVALIPVTLDRTTLGFARDGGRVNLEVDCIARLVARQVAMYREREGDGAQA